MKKQAAKQYRTATAEDFKPGTKLITSEGYEFIIREKYADGIFNCMGSNVVFTNEARFFRIEI
jgi:hypothetical protein